MTFLRTLLVFILFQVVASQVMAQQNMVYNHYFLNPYLFNPSFIAPNGYSELNLNFRKQWAQFEGAPTTLTANLQMPINYKMGWAINLYNDQAGVLQTNTGLASFAYHVYLGRSTEVNHKIGFGLSMGYSMSRVDLSKVDDPTDPSLTNVNTSNLAGQFGMHYQLNNLKLGFALPNLFTTNAISENTFNTPEFNALKNTFSSISYNFNLSDRLAFEPYFIYRTNEIRENQFEVMGVLKINNLLWAGGSYRQDYGPAAFFGFSLKEKIKVGYAYEFAPDVVEGFGTGSHEVHVSVRLGKKQVTRPTRTTTTPLPIEEPVQEPVIEEEPVQEPVQPPVEEVKPTPVPPVEEKQPEEVQPQPESQTLYYVIVGVFSSQRNAESFVRDLSRAGYTANIGEYPANNYHFVYVGKATADLDEAKRMRDEIRTINRFTFKEAWVLPIE